MENGHSYHIDEALLVKYLTGETGTEENDKVLKWLEESDANREYLDSLQKVWGVAGNTGYEKPILFNSNPAWEKLQQRILGNEITKVIPISQARKPANLRILLRVAAILVLAVGSYWIFQTVNGPGQDLVALNSGTETQINSLPDGSEITMNAASTIEYKKDLKGDKREIALKGEAYFKVQRDIDRPFVIEAGGALIEVLGTEFNVKAIPGDSLVEVLVSSGKVKLTGSSEDQAVVLNADEKGVLNLNTGRIVKIETPDLNDLYWKRKILVFRETGMGTVIETLEEIFGKKFIVEKPALNKCKLTATFIDEPIESVIAIIASTFNWTYELNGDEIKMNGEGC